MALEDKPNGMCSLSDEFEDAIREGKTLADIVREYRYSRGYGDGGWGEYFATKIEQMGFRLDPEEMAREQFAGLFDWSTADGRFNHLCGHVTSGTDPEPHTHDMSAGNPHTGEGE